MIPSEGKKKKKPKKEGLATIPFFETPFPHLLDEFFLELLFFSLWKIF